MGAMKTTHSVFVFVAVTLGVTATGTPAFASNPCIAAAMVNLKLTSYETTMTTNHGGASSVSTVDIQKPDRIHVFNPGSEMIAVGHQTWMKMNGSGWKSYPHMDIGSLASMDPTTFMNNHPTDVTCVDAGPGLWHGQPAHVFKSSTTTSRTGVVHATIYQMSDGYVHHMDIADSKGMTASFEISRFNAVKISPP